MSEGFVEVDVEKVAGIPPSLTNSIGFVHPRQKCAAASGKERKGGTKDPVAERLCQDPHFNHQ